jgi:hypothetical protein
MTSDDKNATVDKVETTVEPSANGVEPPTVVAKDTAYKAAAEATELIRVDAGDVSATTVTMDRAGAEQITAERVSMSQSGARKMETKSAQLEQSGVLALRSDNVVLHESAAIAVATKQARVVKSRVAFLKADSVEGEGTLRPLLYIGGSGAVVKPALDVRGAIGLGAALGLVLLLGRLLTRRSNGDEGRQ